MNPITESQELSLSDKWKIYCLYLARYFSLKHWVGYEIIKQTISVNGWKCHDRYEYNPVRYSEDLTRARCVSFDEFIHPENITRKDMGDNWQEQGFAQRVFIDYPMDSLSYWIIRHKDFCR